MNNEERNISEQGDVEDAFLKRVYRDFHQTLRREKLWILAYCLFVVLAAAILTARQPTYYQATATLLIDSDVAQDPAEQRSLSNLDLQMMIIQGPEVIDRVIESAHLKADPVFLESDNPSEGKNPLDVFSKCLTLESDKPSKTIQIHFMDTRPPVAALIANQIAQAYIYEKAARSSGINVDSIESFKAKVTQETEKLNDVQTKLAEMNKKNPELVNEDVVGDQVKYLNSQYILTDAKILELKTNISELEALIKSGASVESQPVFVSHPRVKQELDALQTAELAVLDAEQEYRGMHPLVLKAKMRVKALQDALNEEKERVLEELRSNLKAEEGTIKKIRENMVELQLKDKEVTSQKLEYKDLLSQEASITQTIKLLNEQASKTSVAASFKQTGIQILSEAVVPQDPFLPNKPKNILLALLFAIFSSFGFVFLKCYFDRTFKTEEDVEQLLMKPFLGHLPFARVPKGTIQPNFRNEKEEIYFLNFLRLICANINFLLSGKGNPAIMITGSVPNEGKSFTAYHVACSFAREGKQTILVDVDFCRSVLSFSFPDLQKRPGLHDYLMGKAEAEEIISATGEANLFFIQSQEAQFSAPHALRSDRMKDLVCKLKQDFDVVVFDTPPVLAINDAVALGEIVDLRVLVIEWGKTAKDVAQRSLKKIAPSNLVLAAIILNKAKHWGSSYYYDHYYDGKKKYQAKKKKG